MLDNMEKGKCPVHPKTNLDERNECRLCIKEHYLLQHGKIEEYLNINEDINEY